MNPKVKELLRELAAAITESVEDSDTVQKLREHLKDLNYEPIIEVELSVKFHPVHPPTKVYKMRPCLTKEDHGPIFNDYDVKFLKSLRISVEDEVNGPAETKTSPGDRR